MSEMAAGKSLHICLFFIFSTQVFGVPTSQHCPPTQTLTLDPGSRLELECQSTCRPTTSRFEWVKSGAEGKALELDTYELVIESVSYDDGGIYSCRCLPDGPQCEQSVYITPAMEFVANDKFIYNGDAVEFTCSVSMSQPKYPTIRLASGGSLAHSSHEKEENDVNSHTMETGIWLYEQKAVKEDYTCEVESYCGDTFMETLKRNLSIYSYTPPEVVFTTEFNLNSAEDFGKPAKVSCSVLSSPDTGHVLDWFFKGKAVPLNTGKYNIQTSVKNEGVTEYILVVNNLQMEDLGKYICRITSDFRSESNDEVWIKFNNEVGNEEAGNESISSSDSSFAFYFFCTVAILIMGVVGVWLKRKVGPNKERKRV